MKAQTLAICIPNGGCDKNCPYCISKMTGYLESNWIKMVKMLPKVKRFAEHAQITDVLITGKGEPLVNPTNKFCCRMIGEFKHWPVVLQTNGRLLQSDLMHLVRSSPLLERLAGEGLDILAISIDEPDEIEDFSILWKEAKKLHLVTRATVNLIDHVMKKPFSWYVKECQRFEVDQLSFREITIPNYGLANTPESIQAQNWIKANVDRTRAVVWKNDMAEELRVWSRLIRELPYGAQLFDFQGIAVTYFDYCIQDTHGQEDIRSLIFQEDGHLYTTWNSKASILF